MTIALIAAALLAASWILLMPRPASAHCDTLSGPAVKDGRLALASGNVNFALKWVDEQGEAEVRAAFIRSRKVRGLSDEARELADQYFLETLVRIHRAGEGEGFTGLKPADTLLDPKVVAADAAIESGDLTPLTALVPAQDVAELTRRFAAAQALRDFDVNHLEAGRAYIAAYVDFFKFAEGEEHHHGHGGHDHEHEHEHVHH